MQLDEFDGNFILSEFRISTTNRRLGAAKEFAAQPKRFVDSLRRCNAANQLEEHRLGLYGCVSHATVAIHGSYDHLATDDLVRRVDKRGPLA